MFSRRLSVVWCFTAGTLEEEEMGDEASGAFYMLRGETVQTETAILNGLKVLSETRDDMKQETDY